MKEENILIILSSVLSFYLFYLFYTCPVYKTPVPQEPQTFTQVDLDTCFRVLPPDKGLMRALVYYNIEHPDIVYAQAILESNLGKSNVYKRTNNLFGLYNSKTKDYYSFNHWTESVIAYKKLIQNRYKPGTDYYQFLKDIKYAGDPDYTTKLKHLTKK